MYFFVSWFSLCTVFLVNLTTWSKNLSASSIQSLQLSLTSCYKEGLTWPAWTFPAASNTHRSNKEILLSQLIQSWEANDLDKFRITHQVNTNTDVTTCAEIKFHQKAQSQLDPCLRPTNSCCSFHGNTRQADKVYLIPSLISTFGTVDAYINLPCSGQLSKRDDG